MASSSTHKRHVTSSSHDPTPSVPPLETFEVASDAQPAKGNPTATLAIAAAAPTGSTVGPSSRANYRKAGSVSSILSISNSSAPPLNSVGGKPPPPSNVTQSLGGFNVRVSGQNLSTVVGGDNKSYHHQPTSLLDSHHHHPHSGEPSMTNIHSAPPTSRVPTSGSISANVKPSTQPASSGPVRRLFTSGPSSHQPPAQLISTPAASSQNISSVANPTRTVATTVTSGAGVTLVRTASGHSIPTGKPSVVAQAPPGSGRVHVMPSQASKLSTRPHETGSVANKPPSQVHQQSGAAHAVVIGGSIGSEKQPPHIVKSQVAIGGAAVSMSYSRVINAAPMPAAAVQESSQQQPPQQQLGDVIEQPLQQIMKTPTIFQDPAAQLAKAKKKSTYSDAVGKKFTGVGVSSGGASSGGSNVAISGPPSAMVGISTIVPTSAMAGSGGVGGASSMGSAGSGSSGVLQTVPASSQQISTSAQQHQHKINLAPGTRPMSEKVQHHYYL